MNDREKIIEIIKSNEKAFFEEKVIKGNSIHDNEFAERLADALIEAGIGDVSEYKNHRIIISNPVCRDIGQEGLRLPPEFDLKQFYGTEEVEQIVKERDEWKRRAEVAEKNDKIKERALDKACYDKARTYCPNDDWDCISKHFKNDYIQKAEREIEEEERK